MNRPRERRRKSLPELTDCLRREARRITGARRSILDLLRSQSHPLSNREIFDLLPSGYCDLATVYRSMHLLEEMGLVNRCDFGDGTARFELNDEGRDSHHHHLICRQCSEIVEIGECGLAELELRIAQANHFAELSHKLEFFGVCPACQKSPRRSAE